MNAKPMKIAVLTTLTLSFACIVQAQPEAAQGDLPPPPRFGGPPPPPRPLPLVVLEKFDLNHDGKLDEQERSELHKQIETAAVEPRPQFRGRKGPAHHPGPPPEILDQYDLDKDGRLDETEHAAVKADVDAGKLALPPRPQGAGGPLPPPRPSATQILQKHDLDHDGKLDESELTGFLEAHRPPPRPERQ